jgi:hypothetical protein
VTLGQALHTSIASKSAISANHAADYSGPV